MTALFAASPGCSTCKARQRERSQSTGQRKVPAMKSRRAPRHSFPRTGLRERERERERQVRAERTEQTQVGTLEGRACSFVCKRTCLGVVKLRGGLFKVLWILRVEPLVQIPIISTCGKQGHTRVMSTAVSRSCEWHPCSKAVRCRVAYLIHFAQL